MRKNITLFFIFPSLLYSISTSAFTLSEAWQSALSYSADYTAAQYRRNAELEQEKQARSALLPQVSVNMSYQRQPPSISSSKITQGWNIQLNQGVFDATRIAQYQQGRIISRAAHTRLNINRNELLLQVAEYYFNLLLIKDTIAAASTEKAAYKQQLIQAKGMFKLGTATAVEVYEAQAGYDNALSREIAATAEKLIIENRLTNATGLDAKNIARPNFDNLIPLYHRKVKQTNLLQLQKTALERNDEYQLQKLNVDNFSLGVKAAKGERLPKITASLGYQENQYKSSYQNRDNKYSGNGLTASVQLNFPLFTGGGNNSRIREAIARQQEAEVMLIATERKIKLAVKQAYSEANSAYYQIMAQKRLLESSKMKLQATQTGKQFGLRNSLELVQAQQSVSDAEQKLAQARYRYLMAYLTLAKESGTDLEKAWETDN